MNQFDVVVVGGGIVGLSAAIAHSLRGFSVALIDAGSLSVDTSVLDPRVYAINQASLDLLQVLGVWKYLDASRLSPYHHMHIWDAKNGAHIDFDARYVGEDRLGTIIEESVIKQGLLQCLDAHHIKTFAGCKVTAVEEAADYINIHSEDKSWQSKLLIVADGAASTVRQLMDIGITTTPYHQDALVTTIRTEMPHHHTAYQVFTSGGPLAFLPLPDPHQCSIVWSTSSAHVQSLMELSDDQFAQQLTQAFAEKLGHCEVIGKRYSFPLHMRHTKRYSGARWLLMGDAAHTIHPLAGLGLNVGLADLDTWLRMIDANHLRLDSKKTLAAYQRQRKHAVWQMIVLMGGLKTIFVNPLPPISFLRGLGLNTCNHLLPLKRWFIEQAAGR